MLIVLAQIAFLSQTLFCASSFAGCRWRWLAHRALCGKVECTGSFKSVRQKRPTYMCEYKLFPFPIEIRWSREFCSWIQRCCGMRTCILVRIRLSFPSLLSSSNFRVNHLANPSRSPSPSSSTHRNPSRGCPQWWEFFLSNQMTETCLFQAWMAKKKAKVRFFAFLFFVSGSVA